MRLTTKGRFAVAAMLQLALSQEDGPMKLSVISDRESISLSYLEQLFSRLRRNKLVTSVRGPGGGYLLSKPTGQITAADIIFAVNEPLDTTMCGVAADCQHKTKDGGRCSTHDLWSGLNACILEYLDSVTLEDLVKKRNEVLVAAK